MQLRNRCIYAIIILCIPFMAKTGLDHGSPAKDATTNAATNNATLSALKSAVDRAEKAATEAFKEVLRCEPLLWAQPEIFVHSEAYVMHRAPYAAAVRAEQMVHAEVHRARAAYNEAAAELVKKQASRTSDQ